MKLEPPKNKKQDLPGRALPQIFTSLRRLFFEDAPESPIPKTKPSPKPKAMRPTNPRKQVTLPPFLARSVRWFRGLHPALRWSAGGGSFLSVVAWLLIASLVTSGAVKGLTPETALAAGVYTSSSTDTLGNTHLAANSVTASSTYNLADDDSSEDVQQQLGVDPNWKNGIVRGSGALKLDGSNDYVPLGTAAALPLATQGTVEAWIRTTDAGSGTRSILVKEQNWAIKTTNNQLSTYNQSGNAFCGSGQSINDGVWHHIALTFSGNTESLWIDGVLKVTCANTVWNPVGWPPMIGRKVSSNDEFFNGSIDEVRVSDTVRYAANFTPQRRTTEDSNTIALYHFDEGFAQTVYDSSGNANNGTLGANSSSASDDPTRVDGAQAINQGFKGCSPDDTNDASCSTGGRMGAGNLTLGANSSTTDDKQYEVQMAPDTALSLDGTNDYVTIPRSASLEPTTAITVEGWIKFNSSSPSGWSLVRKGSAGRGYIIRGSGTTVFFYSATISAQGIVTGGYSTTSWTHIAGTFDGTTARVYVNGKLIGSTAWGAVNQDSTADLTIGSNLPYDAYSLSGSIDEVRISNTARYTGEFTPVRRFSTDTATVGLWHMDDGAGQTVVDTSSNANNGTLGINSGSASDDPTWLAAGVQRQGANGDPLYYQYRDVGGTWSTAVPAPSTSTQLGSTGIYLKFNQAGQYSAYDHFLINSWALEAPTTSSPQRGTRRSFPNRTHLSVSSGGLDIIDSSTNTLWMRIPYGGSLSTWLRFNPTSITAKNGTIYIGKVQWGLTRISFGLDDGQYIHSDTCYYLGASPTHIADRAVGVGYVSGCLYEATGNSSGPISSVSTQVIGGVQYFAAAGQDGIYLYNEQVQTQNRYVKTSGDDYTKVVLTSDGKLYAANSTAGGVDVWTNVTADTANQTGADYSYTTISTPALRSNNVNSLSATVGTSTAQTNSNTLAIGHDLGADTIDEHPTQASSTIRYYTREGSTGSSGYSQKQFGGAMSFDGTNDYTLTPDSASLRLPTNLTAEAWVKTTNSATGANTVLSKWGSASSNRNYWLGKYSSSVFSFYVNDSEHIDINLSYVNDGAWHHIAGVANATSSTLKIYVDGLERGSTAYSGTARGVTSSNALVIGKNDADNNFTYWKGHIDEVRISNTARYTSSFTPTKTPFTTDANTVALYHFNERDGQTIYDSSANANNGTLGATSSVSTDDPLRVIPAISGASDKVTAVGLTKAGGTARGLSMDGSNDIVSVPDSGSINLTGNKFSVSAWIKLNSTNTGGPSGQYPGIINKGSGYTNIGYEFFYNGSGTDARIGSNISASGGSGFSQTGNIVPANTWTQVALVFDGGTVYYYVNGAVISTSTHTGNLVSASAYSTVIGKRDAAAGVNGGNLNGKIANVRQYSVGLGATDIANLYNAERAGRTFDGYSGNLVGYWKLDERTGQTITDSSGSGNNGTFGATSSVATDDPTPSIDGPGLTQSPTLWVATNGSGSDDGAVTSIGGPNDLQTDVFTTSNSDLPDLDVTSLSMSSGGLAFIGTENGGWSTGTGGAPELTNGERKGALHITGQTRITGKSRVSK